MRDSSAGAGLTADEQAPPLLPVAGARLLDGAANLLVALHHVVVHLLALLLNVLHQRLLLHDDVVEVLEQLRELHHLALDLLDGLVALLDIPEARLGLAAAVRVQQLRCTLAARTCILSLTISATKSFSLPLVGRPGHWGPRRPRAPLRRWHWG